MRFWKGLVFSGLMLSAGAATPVTAEEGPWSATLNTGFYTDYMFRGFQLYDGSSIQPSLAAAYDTGDWGSVKALVWSHLSAEGGRGASEKFTEVDYIGSWEKSFDPVTLTFGHILYNYPDSDDNLSDTSEFFATAVIDVTLHPTFSVYHDYDLIDGQYYELGLSEPLPNDLLGAGFNLTPFAAFGFSTNSDEVYEDDGLAHVTFGMYTELAMGDISVTPSLNYTASVDDNTENEFWSGMNLSYGF